MEIVGYIALVLAAAAVHFMIWQTWFMVRQMRQAIRDAETELDDVEITVEDETLEGLDLEAELLNDRCNWVKLPTRVQELEKLVEAQGKSLRNVIAKLG